MLMVTGVIGLDDEAAGAQLLLLLLSLLVQPVEVRLRLLRGTGVKEMRV